MPYWNNRFQPLMSVNAGGLSTIFDYNLVFLNIDFQTQTLRNYFQYNIVNYLFNTILYLI